MIKINQLRFEHEAGPDEIYKKSAKILRCKSSALSKLRIVKKSIDARQKNHILYIYSVLLTAENEDILVKRSKSKDVSIFKEKLYRLPILKADLENIERPVIVGFGPAGMFAALLLSKAGLKPLVIERGEDADSRKETIESFWQGKALDSESNVQFGEGGAGTFSDGKLNTLVNDNEGRSKFVLENFVRFGADSAIITDAKPHIGSDVLIKVVKNLRKEFINLGGEIRFKSKMTDFETDENGRVSAVIVNGNERIPCSRLILAIGHSARDTFELLHSKALSMEAKPFAVGVRVEHSQEMINKAQYGDSYDENLSESPYKVTAKASDGRGVYSFCMCPGGYVVNASSEEGRLVTNGMSNHGRDSGNANSAIIVTVSPEDYGGTEVLSGVEFQRTLEEKAFRAADGMLPYQRFEDFEKNKLSSSFGKVTPKCKGQYKLADLRNVLPEFISKDIIEGMHQFGQKISGFDDADTLLSGVESRTSSPVRIIRDESGNSSIKGIYPSGEGAGYAGGIMSAAMDGMKTAEKIIKEINQNGK